MADIKDVSLLGAAPESLTGDAECASLLGAMEKTFRRIAELTDRLILLPNIDRQPSEVVDALAWHYHVDFYDASLPLETRRELVKNHNEWHRIKGTPAAVERIIQTVFGDGYLREWFEAADMEPYTFEVHTTNATANTSQIERFIRAVGAVKNVRSHLTRIVIDDSIGGTVYTGAALQMYDKTEMEAE